jgi:hypothetical protein
LEKSELIFSSLEGDLAHQLASILHCKKGKFLFTYLGIPLSDKKLPKRAFMLLIQRVHTRLSGGIATCLSLEGRIVLTNAVLSALLVYYMSVFQLPLLVIAEIDKVCSNFLWQGIQSDKRKLHLAIWV